MAEEQDSHTEDPADGAGALRARPGADEEEGRPPRGCSTSSGAATPTGQSTAAVCWCRQDTVGWSPGGKMPDHRIRNSYPFIASIMQAKVSAATQRIPGYEVVPSTTEPDDAQAADLAAKVLLYGYDEWRLRRATTKTVEHALVGGEGFAYPFFDTSLGPFSRRSRGTRGQQIAQGDDSGAGAVGQRGVLGARRAILTTRAGYVVEQARPARRGQGRCPASSDRRGAARPTPPTPSRRSEDTPDRPGVGAGVSGAAVCASAPRAAGW